MIFLTKFWALVKESKTIFVRFYVLKSPENFIFDIKLADDAPGVSPNLSKKYHFGDPTDLTNIFNVYH